MSTTTTNQPSAASSSPADLGAGAQRATGLVADRFKRVRSGDLGAWPVIIGLIVIWAVFQSLSSSFLSSQNLSNLAIQIAATGVISVGVVLVLLLGEIDLSVGSVAGVGSALLVVLYIRHGWPVGLAILAAVVAGALIGLIQGFFFARVGVPSFVVTLAGNLGWLGLQLWVLLPQGTIQIPYNGVLASVTHQYLSQAVGWGLAVVVVAIYAVAVLFGRRRRIRAELPVPGLGAVVVRIVGLAVLVGAAVAVLNSWLGVPVALLILVGLVVIVDLVLRRTRYGRAIFAVGGNVEAARRAGINVPLIRMSVFAVCSLLAAFGGVLLTSRGFAAGQSTGADELLPAIAGAVIGGVSLFGGRGSPYGALLGALVLGSISSGMYLLSLDSSVRNMITAAVLLAAVVLDSLSRRGRRAAGRE
jgi:D-xylose transport system permease protein